MKTNNKQSSVEWLISQLQKSKDWHRVLNEISQMSSAKIDIIEQAKAMHREEIVSAHFWGQSFNGRMLNNANNTTTKHSEVTMSNNKPLIAGILSMVVIYLLISFALWEINPKNWHIAARVAYAMFSPVVSCLVYAAIKNINK